MTRIIRGGIAVLLIAWALPVLAAPGDDSDPAAAAAGVFLDGRWEGRLDLGKGPEEFILRLFPADPESGLAAGGLIDLPARKLFGYPLEDLWRDSEGLSFTLLGGAPIGGVIILKGVPDKPAPGQRFSVSGAARIDAVGGLPPSTGEAAGSFILAYSGEASRTAALGAEYRVDTGRGLLPGSLLLPEAATAGESVPLLLLLSGAAADRDGNNWFVPGRSDALAGLALRLRDLGVASLRFDKRGTGEAYRFAAREEDLRFEDHVEDARAAIARLAADPRFTRVSILGYGEGALVGVLAVAEAKDRVAGLAALCASGRTELEIARAALASTPQALKSEAEAILAALAAGASYPEPGPYFADYFRPSIQRYLSSLFRLDIRSSLAKAPCPVLVIAGGRDLQLEMAETELLASARSDAAYRVIPGMSHALKAVGDDEEANYASFVDPFLPLAEGLGDLVAAFAKGVPLPGEDPRAAKGALTAAAEAVPEAIGEGAEGLLEKGAGQDRGGGEAEIPREGE